MVPTEHMLVATNNNNNNHNPTALTTTMAATEVSASSLVHVRAHQLAGSRADLKGLAEKGAVCVEK